MVKYIHASNKAIGCIIPVDIVANLIVVVSALMAEKEGLHVFHSATSCRNPTTFKFSRDMVELYWNANPPEK